MILYSYNKCSWDVREPIAVPVRRLSWSISIYFVTIHACAAINRQIITRTLYFKVQGHSRSSTMTFLRSSSPVPVMFSSMSVPICNHFHIRQTSSEAVRVRRLPWSIFIHFVAIHASAARHWKKFTKTPYLWSSKSFKVIDVNIPKKLVTSACYVQQHVCAYLQPFLC